jgi:hypothetical protein
MYHLVYIINVARKDKAAIIINPSHEEILRHLYYPDPHTQSQTLLFKAQPVTSDPSMPFDEQSKEFVT